MPDREKDELWLLGVLRSQKAGKAAAVLCIAGMIICILLLLPPVQGFLVPFAASYASLPFIVLAVLAFAVCCLFAKEFSAFLEKAGNSRLISAFAIIILAACLGFIGIFSYRHGWQWIDSDQSSEMVLGKLLAEENALVSANWFYGNEIRLVHQIIFTMPLFKLLGHNGNWALIRSLNIMLNNLVLLFSCIFMMQQLKVQRKWILISSVFLLIPLSVEYWDIVTFGGNYIFFIAQFFFCFGLFIRAKKIGPAFVLFLTASCILGMQGIRTLYSFHIPLLLTCIYIRVTMTPKKNFPLFLGSAGFIACCSGYAVNCLLHFWFKFQSYDIMTLDNIFANFFSKLSRSLATLAGFFGFAAGKPLLSASGFFGIAAIIVTFIVLGIIFKVFRQRQFKAAEQFVPVFFGVSVLFNVFIFIISNQSILSRYFLPFMVFYIPLAAILFAYAEKSFGYVKRAAVICGAIIFIAGQGYLNFQSLFIKDNNSIRKPYIGFLLENRLDYGFATHWNANVTCELSNGQIEVAGMEPRTRTGNESKQFRILDSLNPVKFFNPLYHRGKSFLLLTSQEWNSIRGRYFFAAVKPDYEDNNFVVIIYPSAQIIYDELLEM